MGSKRIGTSMGGRIEYTKSDKTKQFIRHKDNIKKRNAKVCIDCESNKEGYCNKFNAWCSKVNYRCNGYEMSYDEKLQLERLKSKAKKEKKTKEKIKKKTEKKKKNKSELGKLVKPKFDTTELTRKKDL